MAEEWYYTNNGQQMGPVSAAALRQLVEAGNLKATDLVWKEGMSQWAPASTTRGLFAVQVQAAPLPAQPVPAPAPAPAPQPIRRSRDYDDDDYPRERRSRPARRGGMSTGVKLVLVGGLFFVFFCVLLVSVVVAMFIFGTSNRTRKVAFNPPPNPQPIVNPNPNPPPGPGGDPGINVGNPPPQAFAPYDVTLNGQVRLDRKSVTLPKNQMVRITVDTWEWGGGKVPDVDLFVYDSRGQLLVSDTRISKDCVVELFTGDNTNFIVEVKLYSGNQARCTVRY
jgi:hypothetical protein